MTLPHYSKKALEIPNIRLPKEFVDLIIGKENEDTPKKALLIHSHGVSRTFADLVIARNNKVKFVSPDEVISFIKQYFDRFKRNGDDVAFIAVRIFGIFSIKKNCLRMADLMFMR